MDTRITNWWDKTPATRVDLLASSLIIPAFTIATMGAPGSAWNSTINWTYTLPRSGFILTPLDSLALPFSLGVDVGGGVVKLVFTHKSQVGITLPTYANEPLPTTLVLWPLYSQDAASFTSALTYQVPFSLVEDLVDLRSRDDVVYAAAQTIATLDLNSIV